MQLSESLTQNLYAAFPNLYRGRHKDCFEGGSMCWGFECGDGWYEVLYELSQNLDDYLKENPAIDFEVVQVKSKFGFLRFRLNYRDTQTARMIASACEKSRLICE